jgi:anthranilate synthase component I
VYKDDGAGPGEAFDEGMRRVACMEDKISTPIAVKESTAPPVFYGSEPLKPVIGKPRFCQNVNTIKDHIMAGDVIQTVISQPFTAEAPSDPIALYRAQRYVNPSPYMFFMHLDDTILIGSSPETMVRLENRVASLRPIAGTRPRGKTEQEDRKMADDLLADEKERAEHLMLVDLGRNDLGRVAETGTVQVTDLMVVERYSHVMHLVSNITCDLMDGVDAFDLLAASFPAGTLSGAPKVRAMEIIAALENEPRGPYGGAVGYLSFHGNMDLAITIRTASIEKGKMTVRAGAGIVADSVPEKEYDETINKAMAIGRAIELVKGVAS